MYNYHYFLNIFGQFTVTLLKNTLLKDITSHILSFGYAVHLNCSLNVLALWHMLSQKTSFNVTINSRHQKPHNKRKITHKIRSYLGKNGNKTWINAHEGTGQSMTQIYVKGQMPCQEYNVINAQISMWVPQENYKFVSKNLSTGESALT